VIVLRGWGLCGQRGRGDPAPTNELLWFIAMTTFGGVIGAYCFFVYEKKNVHFGGEFIINMLLLIPSIEIKDGVCVQQVKGSAGLFSRLEPLEMAKQWRIENAKSLHITDIDGALLGKPVNLPIVKEIIRALDIPVGIGGGMRTLEDVNAAFDAGVYRVVIGTMLIERTDEAIAVLEKHGASKVCISIDAENGVSKIKGQTEDSFLTAASVAMNAKELGFKRIIYKDLIHEGERLGPNFAAIKTLAETIGMRVTASGGVSNLDDLLKLQEMEKFGVDSVIVGRSLYENKYSCQAIWRMSEENNYPYTAKV